MKIRSLSIEGTYEITPTQHGDRRGLFLEWFRGDQIAAEVGHSMNLAQANISISGPGVVRGVHFADVPPGQAKYITCVRGVVVDVVVDLRVGSPTFKRWEAMRLDEVDRRAVYIGEGLGHAYCALTDATLIYFCSQPYNPEREHAINPLDPDLAIDWPTATPVLSARDEAAPSLADAQRDGLLPDMGVCRAYTRSLRAR